MGYLPYNSVSPLFAFKSYSHAFVTLILIESGLGSARQRETSDLTVH